MYESDVLATATKRDLEEVLTRPATRPAPMHLKLVKPIVRGDIRISVHTSLAEVEQDWRAFEATAVCTVFQTFGWLSKWQRHVGAPDGIRPAIAIGRGKNGAILFLFPLSVETRGLVRRLTWLGHELCDYNAPLLAPEFLRDFEMGSFTALFRDIAARIRKELRLRFDLVDLSKMPEHLGSEDNPFARLDVLPHPSSAHVATLTPDWEGFYTAKRSTATRKKERKKLKQLGEIGPVQLDNAQDSAGRAETMQILIGQKSHWFSRMGVNDIFARRGNREFFMDIATDPAMAGIVHVTRLKVGDISAASSMGLVFNGGYLLVLSSYMDAEISRLGPGRAHLHELMRFAIAAGLRWFDFTVGDEPYKRDWSDREEKLFDYLAPTTIRGQLAVLAALGFRKAKRFIKATPVLWRTYSSLRALKGRLRGGGPKGAADTEASGE